MRGDGCVSQGMEWGQIHVGVRNSSFGRSCVRNIDVRSDECELAASRGVSDCCQALRWSKLQETGQSGVSQKDVMNESTDGTEYNS